MNSNTVAIQSALWAVLMGVGLGLVLLIGGCGTLDQGPGEVDGEALGENRLASEQDLLTPEGRDSGKKGFFPLDIGNHWTYAGEFTLAIDGGPPYVTQTREERSIIGTEELSGRRYVLEKRIGFDEDGDTLSPYWFRYRQDGAGLYEADTAANEPPLDASVGTSYVRLTPESRSLRVAGLWQAISRTLEAEHRDAYRRSLDDLCLRLRVIDSAIGRITGPAPVLQGPPGGVLPDEITLLKYPLHPSQEWTIRDDPFYVFGAVEAHEVLDLPPGRMNGYKIRIDNGLFGPSDWGYVWYGRDGYLGLTAHLETEILDPNGNPMGALVFDEHTLLESLDLVGKGRW